MCSFIWWFYTRNSEEAERRKFEAQLWLPPKGDKKPIPKESPWSAENETKAFAALRRETGL